MSSTKSANKVWVLDDDESILEVVQLIFEQEKLEGEFFHDPQAMQTKLDSGDRPKLLLLDVFMKGVNGVDIALEIKTSPSTNQIPIILLTADLDAAKKADRAKAEGYLMKPFDIDELLAVVQDFTQEKNSQP